MIQLKQNTPVQPDIKVSQLKDGVDIEWRDGTNTLQFTHSFSQPSLYRRINSPGQAIVKACSNKQRSIHNVLDLTGGWGIDSFILAHHGKRVTMLEQSDVVYSITAQSLENALVNPQLNNAAKNINSIHINSLEYLSRIDSNCSFDCIYLDPMFSAHKSTAKPAKEMQLLQKLTKNLDIEACFELALKKALNRVVVKRSAKAPSISSRQPDLTYKEKTIRFDVYLTAGRA